MVKKPRAQACADLAMAEVEGELIPYMLGKETLDGRGADCQGLIEAVVRALGGKISYRGSNDMYRNACVYVGTLKEAKAAGYLVPGAVLFIVKKDGKEPLHYKDGFGNASHIGWYTGGRYEVVHASSSKRKVVPSALSNAWTHVGWLKAVDYQLPKEENMENNDYLALGSRGPKVQQLQESLMSLGYDIGSRTGADGIYGKMTQKAVEQFQQDHGLALTGNWDEAAKARLLELLTRPVHQTSLENPAIMIRALAQELLLIADRLG